MSIERHNFNSRWGYSCFVLWRSLRQCVSYMIPRFLMPRRKITQPPYAHFTQIGDPVLRFKAMLVSPNDIHSLETAKIIVRMVQCLRRYGCVGVAAPQIGIPLRIIVMEFKEYAKKSFSADEVYERQMSIMPLTIFINPVMEITSDKVVKYPEGCLSLCGYGATVPRFEKCIIRGIGKMGTPNAVELHGWNARIAQHQMDHLEGKFFIDRMDISTFHCIMWRQINDNAGKGTLIFNEVC